MEFKFRNNADILIGALLFSIKAAFTTAHLVPTVVVATHSAFYAFHAFCITGIVTVNPLEAFIALWTLYFTAFTHLLHALDTFRIIGIVSVNPLETVIVIRAPDFMAFTHLLITLMDSIFVIAFESMVWASVMVEAI